MSQLQFKKPVVIAVASFFVVLLVFGFWRKLNPAFDKNAYYRDAAKASAVEGDTSPMPDGSGGKPAPIASDKAYQPESGSN